MNSSIIKRAQEKDLLQLKIWNLRDFTADKHKKVDDAPYGGGKGMVLKCEPVFRCIKKIKKENPESLVILTSPQGEVFNQKVAENLSGLKGMIIICGHYEGIDERVQTIVDREISIGDYVLTGGEIPSMVLVDSVARLLPGVITDASPKYDSFTDNLLDWPCYTRPEKYMSVKVPDVLLSGNHEKIRQWRLKKAIEKTKDKRPDIYRMYLKKQK